MYLKSIEIHGFKSFANKINLDFHNGITGIVGPNGSGKSNVADAVRWVLGEQSAKQLRGSNMQDVIFSGTQNRKSMGYAYVAITLDNADHSLPVDFNEVTIARRVYRSGESEYLINGNISRLKDVHEMFYDTGIGKEGYSIIGQGQIDRILSGKPEDRRELFDEAAGIVKFKRRKLTSVKKLEDEQNNLLRVNDILTELEKQVEPLSKQSEVARVYLKKREELKTLDVNRFLIETESIKDQLNDAEGKSSTAVTDLEKSKEELSKIKEEYESVVEQTKALDEQLESKRNEITQNDLLRGKLEGQIGILNEQINSTKASEEHLHNRLNSIKADEEERNAELALILKNKKVIDDKVLAENEKLDIAKEELSALQSYIEELTGYVEKGQQDIIKELNEQTSVKARLSRFDTMLEQINIRKAELNSRLLRAKSDEAELATVVTNFEDELKRICDELSSLEEKIANKELGLSDFSKELANTDELLQENLVKFHAQKSKLESLKNLTERYEGYGSSVRHVMEQKKSNKNICGVVADLLHVNKKYEIAIETALGGNIQNVVTEDEKTAKSMISFLKENRLGRATFLPLTSVQHRTFNAPAALTEKGVIGLASDLVDFDDKYKEIASHLLGNYIVVDNVDNALALAKKFDYTLRCVTVGGEALNPGGSISGGAFKNNSNLLGRNREMEELEASVKALDAKNNEYNEKIENIKNERRRLRTEIEELKSEQQAKFILQNTAKMNLNQAKEQLENTAKGYESLHGEESDIEMQLSDIAKQKDDINAAIELSETTKQTTEENIIKWEETLKQKREEEGRLSAQVSELELSTSGLVQSQEFEEKNVERLNLEISKLTEESASIQETLNNSSSEIESKLADIEKLKETISAALTANTDNKGSLDEMVNKKEELSAKAKALFDKREDLSEKTGSLDKEVFRLNNQREKLAESAESLINYMFNEYDMTLSEAKELRNEELSDLPAMKKRIYALRSEIRELGDVNVNAIEDYRTLMERYDFLKTQRDDLIEAREALEKIIAELDEAMRKQFSEKFSQISENFDKVFKELFGGGKGTLELMEDTDVLDAGIKIIAQPPGKKLQNMMMLSGGEKALTAIALLFAIQNLKPSPFCLLDEIEAALDESNVGRFAGYLNKLTKNTQFIVITHRRGTMDRADRLYGITMQEKGVSALVSVNLIDEKDLA